MKDLQIMLLGLVAGLFVSILLLTTNAVDLSAFKPSSSTPPSPPPPSGSAVSSPAIPQQQQQQPSFSSSITPPAFSSRITPPGEQQQTIIPGIIPIPGQGQGQQQQQPEPIVPGITQGEGQQQQQQQQQQPEPIVPGITQGEGQQQQQPEQAASQGPVVDGFKADGTVNSVVSTPSTKWIATGNWSMFAGNGKMISFVTNMTWYNNNGTASHSHEFLKFVPTGGNVTLGSDNGLHLNGLMDVGTNNRVAWKNVHSVIDIKGGKALSVSVNDQETKNHFAAQPIYGVVTSMIRCSDEPGANMEVLQPCTSS
jgi:hypothetical protein